MKKKPCYAFKFREHRAPLFAASANPCSRQPNIPAACAGEPRDPQPGLGPSQCSWVSGVSFHGDRPASAGRAAAGATGQLFGRLHAEWRAGPHKSHEGRPRTFAHAPSGVSALPRQLDLSLIGLQQYCHLINYTQPPPALSEALLHRGCGRGSWQCLPAIASATTGLLGPFMGLCPASAGCSPAILWRGDRSPPSLSFSFPSPPRFQRGGEGKEKTSGCLGAIANRG